MASRNSEAQKRFQEKMKALHTDEWYSSVGAEVVCKCALCDTTGLGVEMFYKQRVTPTGFTSYCKPCQLYTNRNNKFKRRYGVSSKERDQLWVNAKECCEICGKQLKVDEFHLDHCHSTGFVRGVLCINCNNGLGQFKDSVSSLERAISYLKSKAIV